MALKPLYPLPQRGPRPLAASRSFIAEDRRTAWAQIVDTDGATWHWTASEPSGAVLASRVGPSGTLNGIGAINYGVTGLVNNNDSDPALELVRGTGGLGTAYGLIASGDAATLIDTPSSWTFEIWIEPAGGSTTTNQNLLSRTNYGFYLTTANVPAIFSPGTTVAANALSAGSTYHVMWTYDGPTTTHKVYVDDIQVISVSAAITTGGNFGIGAYGAPNGDNFNGIVDEAAFYPTVLSAVRRTAHYDLGKQGAVSLNRTASDSLNLAETLTRAVAFPRAITESVTLSESLARAVTNPRVVAESITIGESLARIAEHPRAIAESITLTESLARIASDSRFPADGIALSDSAAGTANPGRTATDTITLTENLTRGALTLARSATDAETLTDAVTRTSLRNRAAADSMALSDVATGIVSGGPQTRSATDSLSLADTATRQLSEARSVSDSLVLSDAASGTIPPPPGTGRSRLLHMFVGRP